MDPITRRSATLATVIHACLIAVAFVPRGCSEIPDPTPPPVMETGVQPQPTPPPPAIDLVDQPVYGALVSAPLPEPADTSLPALRADDLPALPDLTHLVTSVRQDHAGLEVQRGSKQGGTASGELPALSANPDDLIAQVQRGTVSNETLTREQRMLGSAQEFIQGRLQDLIDRRLRHLLKQVTEPRLIIEIRVDQQGRPLDAHLVNSSGSLTLDRLIEEWLHSDDFRLPPVTPEVLYPFLIVIRR